MNLISRRARLPIRAVVVISPRRRRLHQGFARQPEPVSKRRFERSMVLGTGQDNATM